MNRGLFEIPKAIARSFRTIILGNPSGNPRGVGAVEIIPSRTANTQVASGTNSVAVGVNSTASGNNSTALGNAASASSAESTALGDGASASGLRSVALGNAANASNIESIALGDGASALGAQSVALGNSALAQGLSSIALGDVASVSGAQSVALGYAASASGSSAVALGFNASADSGSSLCVASATTNAITGHYVFGHANAAANRGRHQRSELMLQSTTASTVATRLTSDNTAADGANQLTLRNNSALMFFGQVVAYNTVTGDTKAWTFQGAAKRGAAEANTALVGAVSISTIAQDTNAAAGAISITADTTTGSVAVTGTAWSANPTRWTVIIRSSEVSL